MPFAKRPGRLGVAAVDHHGRWLERSLGAAAASEDGVLLLSEALTNAVVHGGGEIVEVDAFVQDGVLRVEVVDGGGGGVPHYAGEPCGEGGRGLPIISVLARAWGYEVLDDGRLRVWFEVSCAPAGVATSAG
ncbi:ATP-binding protein [Actinomadura vinacea]|uniref:ATP-binding protein n=1 Tax=Actinomadura vinacea TaxID=115336 RepID=UPI0031E3FADA